MKNYRAQTPQNLALTKILQISGNGHTPWLIRQEVLGLANKLSYPTVCVFRYGFNLVLQQVSEPL